jgi:hypothetical protein
VFNSQICKFVFLGYCALRILCIEDIGENDMISPFGSGGHLSSTSISFKIMAHLSHHSN